MATDNLMANLLKIATSGESEAVRLRATMDALDRAGLTERAVIEVGITNQFDALLTDIIDLAVVEANAVRSKQLTAAPEQTFEDDWDTDDGDGDRLTFDTPGTITVDPPVQVITTVPASRPNPPAYLKRLAVLTKTVVDVARDLRVELELSRNRLGPTEVSRVSR